MVDEFDIDTLGKWSCTFPKEERIFSTQNYRLPVLVNLSMGQSSQGRDPPRLKAKIMPPFRPRKWATHLVNRFLTNQTISNVISRISGEKFYIAFCQWQDQNDNRLINKSLFFSTVDLYLYKCCTGRRWYYLGIELKYQVKSD